MIDNEHDELFGIGGSKEEKKEKRGLKNENRAAKTDIKKAKAEDKRADTANKITAAKDESEATKAALGTPPATEKDNTKLYVGGGIGAVLVIGVILYFVFKR